MSRVRLDASWRASRRRLRAPLLAGALVVSATLLLAACGVDLTGGPPKPLPEHPVIERFTIDGKAETLIVTQPATLTLEVSVASGHEIERVEIHANAAPLHTFTAAPYRHEWQVDAADNGFYSFEVRAQDTRGNSAVAHYESQLGINIQNGE